MGHPAFLSDNIMCKTCNQLTLLPPVLVQAYAAVIDTRTSRGTRERSFHAEERKVHVRVYSPTRSAEHSLACHTPTRGRSEPAAAALQHWRQGAGEASDVILTGHK